jgi:biotin synthase
MIRAVTAQRPHITRFLATHASNTRSPSNASLMRHDWTRDEIQKIYDSRLMDLVFRAAAVHRQIHDPSKIQLCTLMNIKSMFSSIISVFC